MYKSCQEEKVSGWHGKHGYSDIHAPEALDSAEGEGEGATIPVISRSLGTRGLIPTLEPEATGGHGRR
jgi:hypothetical protein